MTGIKQELIDLGFNVDSIGIIYWIDAIKIMQNNPLQWDVVEIYEYIAKKYGSTYSNVERAMRHAITPAKKNIQEKYNYYKNIKNSTFLKLIKIELI